MKPISIKVVMNPESANKLSSASIRNLTISGSTLKIGRERYDIKNIESLTLEGNSLTMCSNSPEIKFGVQTFGLKNVTNDYLTDLVFLWIQAIKVNDQTTIQECVTKIKKSKQSHEIRVLALLFFFPTWLIFFLPVSKIFAGWFGDSMSHQTTIRLGCGIYAILTSPIWVWIFKKGDGFAFELNNKQNQNIDPTRKTPVEVGND